MMTNLFHGAHVANKLFSTIARLRLLLVMFLTLTVSANVWGETYTMTIDQNGNKGTKNVHITNTSANSSQDVSYNEITWSVAWEGNGAPMQGSTTECQFGSSKNPCSMVTLSTSDIMGTITSIKINARGAKGNNAVVAVNVGGSTFINGSNNSVSIGTVDGDKELSGEAIGTIVITISQTTSTAIFIKSISVTYEENSCSVKPTVGATLQSLSTTENSITATIPISSIGGCNITENGLVYSTSNVEPTVDGSGCSKVTTTACGSTAANQTVTITGLICGQSYYIRGYAINGAGTSYTNVSTESTSDCPKYTVTLKDDNSTLTQITAGGSVTLPPREGCEGYTFAGWTKTWTEEQEEWTTTAPTIISAGSYTPTANESLYPVYTKTEGGGSEPIAYSAGDEGDFVIASYNTSNSKWYAIPETPTLSSSKIAGVEITVSQTAGDVNYVSTANAEGYTWTIADATNGQTISDGTQYIYHSNGGASGTNLAYGTSTSYTWKIEKENNGLTFKGMNGSTTNSRGLLFNGSVFGGYALSNEDESGYYRIQVLPIGGGSTTYYHSTPDCGSTQPSRCLTPKMRG